MDTRRWWSALVVAVALFPAAPALAQSCEQKLAELDRLIAESEGISESNLQAVRMMRDMGARHCEQGNAAAANPILDLQLRNLAAKAEQARDTGLPKSGLTVAYLRGDWCTWQVTDDPGVRRDAARYHFYRDGSFHTGHPPSFRLDTSSDPWPRERFLDQDYQRLIEQGDDEFRTENHGMRTYIWRRGDC